MTLKECKHKINKEAMHVNELHDVESRLVLDPVTGVWEMNTTEDYLSLPCVHLYGDRSMLYGGHVNDVVMHNNKLLITSCLRIPGELV